MNEQVKANLQLTFPAAFSKRSGSFQSSATKMLNWEQIDDISLPWTGSLCWVFCNIFYSVSNTLNC